MRTASYYGRQLTYSISHSNYIFFAISGTNQTNGTLFCGKQKQSPPMLRHPILLRLYHIIDNRILKPSQHSNEIRENALPHKFGHILHRNVIGHDLLN